MGAIRKTEPRGAVILKRGSSRLHIKIYLYGRPYEYATGLIDTLENRAAIRLFMDRVLFDYMNAQLDFASAFPAASPKWKRWYFEKSGGQAKLNPKDVNVGSLLKELDEGILNSFVNESVKRDYRNAMNARLYDYFADKSFSHFAVDGMLDFAETLFKKNGDPLSMSRIKKLLTPLRFAYKVAASRFGWPPVEDPCWIIQKVIERAESRGGRVFTFQEWLRILSAAETVAPWYKPIIELMAMTGLIPSELAGISANKSIITSRRIHMTTTFVDNRLKKCGKRPARTRSIPLTDATVQLVDELLARQNSKYLVTMENGSVFSQDRFRETVWKKILKAAEVAYEVPYSLRHTYFGWSLLLDINPNILCGLGGHASRRTLYDHYGKYVEGLEDQKEEILIYLGNDFIGKRGRLSA